MSPMYAPPQAVVSLVLLTIRVPSTIEVEIWMLSCIRCLSPVPKLLLPFPQRLRMQGAIAYTSINVAAHAPEGWLSAAQRGQGIPCRRLTCAVCSLRLPLTCLSLPGIATSHAAGHAAVAESCLPWYCYHHELPPHAAVPSVCFSSPACILDHLP